MKKIVKPLCFSVLLLATSFISSAQTTTLPAEDFGTDIKKVIRDYTTGFSHLLGSIIEERPQSTDYESTLVPAGTEAASITRYSSNKKAVYSWQALVLTSDEFSSASEKYKSLFTRLNNMTIRMNDGVVYHLKGKYLAPSEAKKFHSSILQFDQPSPATAKMKVEVSLQYEMMEWKVSVIVYERDREDVERGEIIE